MRSEQKPLTREEARVIDSWAINEIGIPGVILMENAGRSCAEFILRSYPDQARILIFCGTGNNGGDGFVIARHLYNSRRDIKVIVIGEPEKIKGDARINFDIINKMNIEIVSASAASIAPIVPQIAGGAGLIVDSIFGTGLDRPLGKDHVELIDAINSLGIVILAVDVPSGLDCDMGKPLGAAIKAKDTITFVAAKTGFENPISRQYTGRIHVASIGIERE